MRFSPELLDRALDFDLSIPNTLGRWYQTAADRNVDFVLGHVFDGIDLLSRWLDRTAMIVIHPRHDGFDTNEYIRAYGRRGKWHARLCGRPDRHFGEIPDALVDRLVDADWQAIVELDHEYRRIPCPRCDIVHPFDWEYRPRRRTSPFDVVTHAVRAANIVHSAPRAGWLIHGALYCSQSPCVDATCLDEECWCGWWRADHHEAHDDIELESLVVLPEIVEPGLLASVVWPPHASWSGRACYHGRHDLHSGPCRPSAFNF